MTDLAIQSLTIYLARSGATLKDLINPNYASSHVLDIMIDQSTPAHLYVDQTDPEPPEWVSFFDGFVSPEVFGKNSSTKAALIVEARQKLFALTFGHGRFILNDDFLEEKFGLKVALNCIGEGSVRSLQKRSLDQILRISQEQASRDATPLEFGFDIEQDLLGGVTGSPTEKHFGSRISGSESLHLAIPIQMNGLPDLLDQLADKFLDKSYKSKFPWIDHISEVTNPTLQAELDETLAKEIASGQTSSVWLAVPEIVNWVKISRFRFIAAGPKLEYPDIHLENFIKAIGSTPVTVDLLKRKHVITIDENGEKLDQWPVYKCLYAELDHGGSSYVLSGAKWYGVDKNFVDDVNAEYDAIKDYDGTFPEYQHATEGVYLDAVAKSDTTKYALMDQKWIMHPSKMEFCDLYTVNKDICHIKKYGQAGVLSHLFAQGAVSGELFRSDIKFRQKVDEKLPTSYKLADYTQAPKQDEYRIVFGIVSDRKGPLRIPFFSRLNFKHAAKRLEAYGYRVAKAKIEVEELFSKTAKAKKSTKKIK
ncbi:MAG TPA: TIGR04141 family sporadically distributed protein [Candidatus Angelobacter sp.]|nr:TIGR04141 family sporadically distributed protein [Candidatus Angelobacter sp.]